MIGNLLQHTLIHTVLSVIGVIAGLMVAGAMTAGKRLDYWFHAFFVTTVLTNVTGFGFPFVTLLPSHVVGAVSLALLPVVGFAIYVRKVGGAWRGVWVIGSVIALYLNVFVLVTQLFSKVPAMLALAPTQKEMPFVATHLLVLAMFVALGRTANKGFRN